MSDYQLTRDAAGNVTTQYGQMLQRLKDEVVLADLVREFIELLDVVETTDEGQEHRPNSITSSRAKDAERIEQIIIKLKGETEC